MTTRRHHAFTLLELVIVVAIIVLLIAILMPTLGSARAQARKAKCAANLHSLGTAAGTRQAQMAIAGTWTNGCGLMDLQTFVSDNRVYLCPEDIAPTVSTDAVIATYSNNTHAGRGSASYLFDMAIASGTYCYQTTLSPTNYLLNFEDQQFSQNGGDLSFYNFYLSITTNAAGDMTVTSLSSAPPGDVKPPTCNQTGGPNTGIGGGDSYDLVARDGSVIKSPILRGDTPVTLTSVPTSYGMSTMYPGSMKTNGIIVLDYNDMGVTAAGTGRQDSQWLNNLNPNPATSKGRPASNRHLGRFNALFLDGSVSTSLAPTVIDPTGTVATNRKKWWGE